MLVNQSQLSDVLGVSTVTLTEWQKENPPLPMRAREVNGLANEYETAEVFRWYVQREMRSAKAESPQDKLANVKYERELLGLKKDQGALVDVSEIQPLLDLYVTDVSNTLDGMPEKFAPMMEQVGTPDGRYQLLRSMMTEIRKVLGSYEFSKNTAGTELPAPTPAA